MSNGRSRLFNIVLVCSLAINLLLVGGLIGRVVFGPPPPPMPNHLGWILRSLDSDTRQALRPQLEAHAHTVAPLRRQVRAAQREFENVLTEPQLDDNRLNAALDRLHTASSAYQASMNEEMTIILKKMTLDERKRFVHFLHHRPDEHRARHEQQEQAPGSPPADDAPGSGEPPPGPPAADQPPPPES